MDTGANSIATTSHQGYIPVNEQGREYDQLPQVTGMRFKYSRHEWQLRIAWRMHRTGSLGVAADVGLLESFVLQVRH